MKIRFTRKILFVFVLIFILVFTTSVFAEDNCDLILTQGNSEDLVLHRPVNFDSTRTFDLDFSNNNCKQDYVYQTNGDCNVQNMYYLELGGRSDTWAWKMENSTHNLSFNIVDDLGNDVNNFMLDLYGKNLSIEVDNDETEDPFISTFSSNIPYIINTQGQSEIKIYEVNERPVSYDNKGPFGVKLDLQNIDVNTNASLEIILEAADGKDDSSSNNVNGHGREKSDIFDMMNDNIDVNSNIEDVQDLLVDLRDIYTRDDDGAGEGYKGDGIHGGKVILDVNSISNYGHFDLNMLGGNGGNGNKGKHKKKNNGGLGGTGGDIEINLNYFYNFSNSNILLKSGNGAAGGQGSSEGGWGKGEDRHGGDGGFSGFIFFNIKNIFNVSSDSTLNLDLDTGNGGTAGRGGNDNDTGEHAKGGHGGHSGSIFIQEINNLKNKGLFDLNLFIGTAGNGNKHGDDSGKADGYGGFGGLISNLGINKLINSGNFNYNSVSGKYGRRGGDNSAKKGISGSIGDININYLENKSQEFKISTMVNQEEDIPLLLDVEEREIPIVGSVYINYLNSGSNLPKKISLLDNLSEDSPKWIYNTEHAPEVKINACYIESSSDSSIIYNTYFLDITSSNYNHFRNSFDNDASNITMFKNTFQFCPYCDALDLNSMQRENYNYSIYSNLSGTIQPGDLKIYYANKDSPKQKFKLPGQDQPYLVYKNADPIDSKPCETYKYPGLNKFTINIEDLYSIPDHIQLDKEDHKAYCPAQNYFIEGIVTTDTTTKDFNFMFIPLYDFT